MFTLTEIAEIIAETVNETAKDLNDVTEAMKTIAEVSLVVSQTLRRDPALVDPDARSRSLQVNELSAQIIATLDERLRYPYQSTAAK